MKIPWGVLIWRLPKVIYEVNMSCLRIDIKRLYNSITVRIVLGVLFFLAIVDPLYSRFLTLDSMFASYYGINAYQYWLFNFFLYYRLVLFYFMIRKPLSKYITLLNKVEQYI